MSKTTKKTKWEFVSHIKAAPKVDVMLEDYAFSISAETNENGTPSLLYDDLMDKAYAHLSKRFPEESFPCAYVESTDVIFEGKPCPVLCESDKSGLAKLKRGKKHPRILILPEAHYVVVEPKKDTDSEIYDKLVKVGLIDCTKIKPDSKEFRKIAKSFKAN